MDSTNKDYVARISVATPLKLTIITFELLIENIKKAKLLLEAGDENFTENVNLSKNFLREIINALDMNFEISNELLNIYIYVNKLLIDVGFKKDPLLLLGAEKILSEILDGFNQLTYLDNEADKVMQNTHTIQAGMTYRNGKLEEYISGNEGRGFKA